MAFVAGSQAEQKIALKIENLQYNYSSKDKKNIDALSGVSFKCESSKIYGILGPNGSGKSTTFKLISTQLKLQNGNIFVFGIDRSKNEKEVRKLIGVCFQSPSLDPILTVEENLKIQGTLLGLTKEDVQKEIDFWLSKLSLNDRRNKAVSTLSGGLARRVELIKSLLHKPKLLLLDEPTNGLDPISRDDLWNELRKLRDQGMTIIVTTHLMDEAELCDELLFMAKGKCVAGGTPKQLKKDFQKEFVIFKSSEQEKIINSLKEKQHINNIEMINGKVRIETQDPNQIIDILRNEFRDNLESLEWDKANLADIYRSKTGVELQ